MRNKLIKITLIGLIVLLSTSCNEDLNPFGDHKEVYVLNCVLKNNVDFQSAYLSQGYFVDNFDPYSDTLDHTINNSHVRIWFNDSVKIFSDTSFYSVSSNSNVTSYFHNEFSLLPDTDYEIEAVFNNGRKLRAKTKTPKKILFLNTSTPIIPPEQKNTVSVKWNSKDQQLYMASRFTFIYFKKENGVQVRYEKEVPRTITNSGGKIEPFYPEPSYSSGITVQMDAFDFALREISEDDPDKTNYTILAFILEVLIYDRNLTAYYAAKTELGEGFSISVNESDYTNIEGGKGIFGSFIKQRKAIKFSHDYIRSFGYEPGLTE